MARSQETFGKKEVRIKKEKKRKEKEKKKLERKEGGGGKSFDDMIAYVDEYGNITSTPPDLTKKKVVINAEDIQTSIPKSIASDTNEKIRKGVVTFFNDSKGFGFIKDSANQQSVFVHVNGLLDQIKENNKVTFEIVSGAKGPNAINVKLDKE
jgi:cold shock CspA family protein